MPSLAPSLPKARPNAPSPVASVRARLDSVDIKVGEVARQEISMGSQRVGADAVAGAAPTVNATSQSRLKRWSRYDPRIMLNSTSLSSAQGRTRRRRCQVAGVLAWIVLLGFSGACQMRDDDWEARRDAQRRAMVAADEARQREFDRRMQPEYLKLACLKLKPFELLLFSSKVGVPAATFVPSGAGAYAADTPGSTELNAAQQAVNSGSDWEAALELFTRAAELGNGRAATVLALYRVQQRTYSPSEVVELLSSAQATQDPIALLIAADMTLAQQVDPKSFDPAALTIAAIERGAVLSGCEILEKIRVAGVYEIDWPRLSSVFSRFAKAYGAAQEPPAHLAGILLTSPVEEHRIQAREWLEAKVELWRGRRPVAPFAFALGSRLIERGSLETERGRELLELAARGNSTKAADLLVEAFLGFKGLSADRKAAYRWCLIRQSMGSDGRYDCSRVREGLSLADRAQAQIDADMFSTFELP